MVRQIFGAQPNSTKVSRTYKYFDKVGAGTERNVPYMHVFWSGQIWRWLGLFLFALMLL